MPSNPHDPAAAPPRPVVALTPARPGLPAEGGTVDALLEVSVGFPDADRPPLALALVIDRSGSMSGAPLEAAKGAAAEAVGMLMPGDWVAVVSYDTTVTVDVPLVRVEDDRRHVTTAIRRIAAGSSTALHAGWVEGVTQALACPDEAANRRVVLLSDGLANAGVTDRGAIARDVAEAAGHGVGTSAHGLGVHYDEALLRDMADAGGGNYVFIESPAQVAEVFTLELAGMSALRGRCLRLRSSDQAVRIAHVASDLRRDGAALVLPDLTAGLPLQVMVRIDVDPGTTRIPLALVWDDLLTGGPDEVTLEVELPSLPAAELARLPEERAVATVRTLIEIAESKDKVTAAARVHDLDAARERLLVVEGLVATLPAGEERQREEAELARLRTLLDERDFAMTSRFADKFSYERKRGRKDHMLAAMSLMESDFRRERAAARAGAGLFDGAPATAPTGGGSASEAVEGKLLHVFRLRQSWGRPLDVLVVLGDITEQRVEALVNSTNRGLFGTQGVDGAIHRRGGPELTAAARAIGKLAYGEAVFTLGFALSATYVIHTAAPPWKGTGEELPTLGRCYLSSLTLAQRLGVKSLALPAIGTGTYAYPAADATRVAVEALNAWARDRGDLQSVRVVLADPHLVGAYASELAKVAAE